MKPALSDSAPAAGQADPARWFAEHIQAHDGALKSYLRHAFPAAREEVDDVVQESYFRIWKARAGRPLHSARAFLFTVARHVALDFLRRRRISPVSAVGDLAALPVLEVNHDSAKGASMAEKIALLEAGLAALPPRGREVVLLRKFEGLSQKEVAERLGISEKTVDEHLYRGLRRLGAFLRAKGVTGCYEP